MPFKSTKQRQWMYANKPEMAKQWEEEMGVKGSASLPERAPKSKPTKPKAGRKPRLPPGGFHQ